jgi:arginyl-tRNA synthetase
LELSGERVRFPDNAYKGEYVFEIARQLRSKHGDRFRHPGLALEDGLPADESQGGDKEKFIDAMIERAKKLLGDADYRLVFDAGLNSILDDIRQDLGEFRVNFDHWMSERSLATSGDVERGIQRLKDADLLYEKDGAIWFKAKQFGDDLDRVLVRENGATTYFASDVAYLLNKLERGFDKLVYVFGADHHGYIARLKACAQGLGADPNRIEVKLIQFAVLYRGNEKVQMSTRSGSFVTLRELRDEVGSDAARFFYVMRSHDQHLDFDLDLAKSETNDNPVFYVQMAHARIAGIQRQFDEKMLVVNRALGDASVALLASKEELALLKTLSRYAETLELAAEGRTPHTLAYYLRELAQEFHAFYDAHKLLIAEEGLRNARLNLALAVKQVLRNGLEILGVGAPERM